jgi:ribonuclease HI
MNIWIDGSPALRQNQQGRISMVYEDGRTFVAEIGNCTVNEAEYMAVIEALRSCNEGDMINSDSELVVGQMTMDWKVKAENLKELHEKAKTLLDQKRCKLVLVRREDNKAGKLLEAMPGYRHARSS